MWRGFTESASNKFHDIQHANSVNLRRAYSQSYTFTDRLQTSAQQNHRGGKDIGYPVIFFGHNWHEMTLLLIRTSHTEASSGVILFLKISLPPSLAFTRSFLCGYLWVLRLLSLIFLLEAAKPQSIYLRERRCNILQWGEAKCDSGFDPLPMCFIQRLVNDSHRAGSTSKFWMNLCKSSYELDPKSTHIY